MADTLQCVNWCLEYACPFRQGPAVCSVRAALGSVEALQQIDVAAGNNDVYGDFWVTGMCQSLAEGRQPCIGGRVSQAVVAVGSLEEAHRLCGQCPANAHLDSHLLAGCCFSFYQAPDDAALEQRVSRAIAEAGMGPAFDRVFLKTHPRWYGLWASSPLTSEQVDLLRRILPGLPDDEDQSTRRFIRACELAQKHGLRLHVSLAPPGHTDFGYVTVFAHCPRCKSDAGQRWKKGRSERISCKACGEVFISTSSASEEREIDGICSDPTYGLDPADYDAIRSEWKSRHGGDVTWDPIIGAPNTPALAAEDRARCRELMVGLVMAALVFVGLAIGTVVLAVRRLRMAGWSGAIDAAAVLFFGGVISLFAAAFAMMGGAWATQQIQGIFRLYVCPYCHRPLRYAKAVCDCPMSAQGREELERACQPQSKRA